MIVPIRCGPLFAATEYVTVPFPDPDDPPVLTGDGPRGAAVTIDGADDVTLDSLAIEGPADGVSVKDARAFAVGVQWHPEYWARSDDNSARIFRAFGDAARAYAAAKSGMRTAAE